MDSTCEQTEDEQLEALAQVLYELFIKDNDSGS
jgi:hypothetical protein